MKKILFIVNLDKFFISHRLPIATTLRDFGYEVHIASKFTDRESYLKNLGFFTHDLPIERSSISISSNFWTFTKILKLILHLKPDLVHLITIKPILYGGMISHLFKKTSFVASISGLGYVFSDKSRFSIIRKKLIEILYKIVFLNRKIVVIFQNQDDRKKLIDISKLKKENTTLINGSGVDLKIFSVIPNNNIKNPIALFAGRLLISKGILDFIEASKLFSNIRYVISGGFDFENPDCIDPKLMNKVTQEGLIEYWGYSNNMQDILNESSIVVLPSYYGEGLPKILIEAAACGKPIVTTDHPGCRDAIINNVTGLLVPIKSPISIANAIERIITNNDLKTSMGIQARLLAEKKFSIESVVSEHLKIYRKLTN